MVVCAEDIHDPPGPLCLALLQQKAQHPLVEGAAPAKEALSPAGGGDGDMQVFEADPPHAELSLDGVDPEEHVVLDHHQLDLRAQGDADPLELREAALPQQDHGEGGSEELEGELLLEEAREIAELLARPGIPYRARGRAEEPRRGAGPALEHPLALDLGLLKRVRADVALCHEEVACPHEHAVGLHAAEKVTGGEGGHNHLDTPVEEHVDPLRAGFHALFVERRQIIENQEAPCLELSGSLGDHRASVERLEELRGRAVEPDHLPVAEHALRILVGKNALPVSVRRRDEPQDAPVLQHHGNEAVPVLEARLGIAGEHEAGRALGIPVAPRAHRDHPIPPARETSVPPSPPPITRHTTAETAKDTAADTATSLPIPGAWGRSSRSGLLREGRRRGGLT